MLYIPTGMYVNIDFNLLFLHMIIDTEKKGLFITGTDTDVGKTYFGAQIVRAFHNKGINAVPRKLIESGCERVGNELIPADASCYFEAAAKKFLLEEICPFRFEPAISPQRAARLTNQEIFLLDLVDRCYINVTKNDFLVVEGAGGFYSPLCEDGLNADLAKALQLPVLLVANDKLGCINHILLTIEAIQLRELQVLGVILNRKDATDDKAMNNIEDLKMLLNIPIFSISNNEILSDHSPILDHLTNPDKT